MKVLHTFLPGNKMVRIFYYILGVEAGRGSLSFKALKERVLNNTNLLAAMQLDPEEIEPYIYPIYCGLAIIKNHEPAGFDDVLFAKAWDYEMKHIYKPTESFQYTWGLGKLNLLNQYKDDNSKAMYEKMLDVVFEILRNLSISYSDILEERNRKLRAKEIDKLYTDVVEFRSTKRFSKLLAFVSRYPRIAPYNAMLIYMQKPNSKYVAYPKEWINKFHRHPKPEAKPLIVLHTFGPVGFVYDLNDTEGDPFPEKMLKPLPVTKDGESELDSFRKFLIYQNMEYREKEYWDHLHGYIECVKDDALPPLVVRKASKYFKEETRSHDYNIVINENQTTPEKCATIFHVLAHYFCLHLPLSVTDKKKSMDLKNNNNIPKERSFTSICAKEFEAETVCWLLCNRYGIRNPHPEYLQNYLKYNETIPSDISLDAILKATSKIEHTIYPASIARILYNL